MGLTPRMGLDYFGEDVEGSFTDDGSKYTYGDRLTLDRVIAAFEAHNHQKPVLTPSPSDAPSVVMDTDGTLQAGQTFYYGVSFVDELGLETQVGELVEASTPDILEEPGTPQLETASGGSLPVGTYMYAVTGLRGDEESVLSSNVTAQVIAGQQTVVVTLPGYGEADAMRIWRLGPGEPGYTRIAVVSAPTATFTDDGTVPADPCACDPENLPPSESEGIALYSFEVSLSAADAAYVATGQVTAWKLYRSQESGVWPAEALVHYVVERATEGDPESPLVTSWVDDGDELLVGQPPAVDQTLHFQPISFATGTALPDPEGYDEGYPFLLDDSGTLALYVVHDGAWVPVAGGGSSSAGGGDPFQVVTASDGTRDILTGGTALATEMPGPPTAPSITGFTTTTVDWTAPAHDGGMPLTGYLVRRYNKIAKTLTYMQVAPGALTATFPEVPYGVLQVVPLNKVGWGEPDEVLVGSLPTPDLVNRNAGIGSGNTPVAIPDLEDGTQGGDIQLLTVVTKGADQLPNQDGFVAVGSYISGTAPDVVRLTVYVRSLSSSGQGAVSLYGTVGMGTWAAAVRTYRGVEAPGAAELYAGAGLVSATFASTAAILVPVSAALASDALTGITPDAATVDPIWALDGALLGHCSSDDTPSTGTVAARTATATGTVVASTSVTVELMAVGA